MVRNRQSEGENKDVAKREVREVRRTDYISGF
jgi:hypothetical protein